jgi:hypothetical protein
MQDEDETLRHLIEDETALQRWIGEGGSHWDRFGLMDRIQDQLEHQRGLTRERRRHRSALPSPGGDLAGSAVTP